MLTLFATTNFQSFSTDASSLGSTLFFAALFGLLVGLVFALTAGFLGQQKILAIVEGLVVGVVATVAIAGLTTFVTGQGVIAQGMIDNTWGAIAAITPAPSAGLTTQTLAQWLS